MPTTRKHRSRHASESQDWRFYALRDLPLPEEVQKATPRDHRFQPDAWREQRDEILAAWARKHPGTRPSHWWSYDAPHEARERIGGKGMAYWVALPGDDREETYCRGMPNRWWTTSCPRWLEVTGSRLTPIADAVAYDENDPPTFEAEGVFLERLDLLLPNERVTDREPEVCSQEPWLDWLRKLR